MIVTKHNMTRLYTSVMISLFDDIKLQRESTIYTVPMYLGDSDNPTKRKNKINQDLKYSSNLPLMDMRIGDINYNLQRQTNKLLRKKYMDLSGDRVLVTWNDSSVTIGYNLILRSKTKTEMYQILEHIMGYFKSTLLYVNVKTPLYIDAISTPVKLITTNPEITLADGYEESRTMECQLQFEIYGIFHNHVNIDDQGNSSSEKYITRLKLLQCEMEYLFGQFEEQYLIRFPYLIKDLSTY